MKKPTQHFDTIIIGSGIGGSTAALLLATYFNKKVLLLEKHWTFGGLTHEFTFDGKHFATGVHYIGAVNNNSVPDKLFNIITGGRLQWNKMPHRFDELIFPTHSYALPASPQEFINELSAQYPADARALRRFYKHSKRAFKYMALHNALKSHLPFLHPVVMPLARLLMGFNPNVALQQYLDRRFKSHDLKNILMGQWADHGTVPAQASFMVHAMIFNHYINGAYYPKGGVRQLNLGMLEAVKAAGVQLKLGHEATRIVTQNKVAVGVEVKNAQGQEAYYTAQHIISNVGALGTYQGLLKAQCPPFIARDRPHLTAPYDFFTIYISLKDSPRQLGFDGSNKWIFNSADMGQAVLPPTDPAYPGFYCLLFPSLKAGDATNHTMEVLTMVPYKVFEPWESQPWQKRADAYYALKEEMAQKIMANIEGRYPGFKALVAGHTTSTPLTTAHFVSRARGSSYGVPFTTKRAGLDWLSAKTPFKHLHLSGQDVFGPGLMAAMMGGVSAAANTLGPLGYFKVMRWVSQHKMAQPLPQHRGYMAAKVVQKTAETPQAYSYTLDLQGAPGFAYKAGQFVLVDVPIEGKSYKRAYSLSSCPDEAQLSLTIKQVPGGRVSNHLAQHLAVGQTLHISHPRGQLYIKPEHRGKNLLCIAAGSGITPVYAIIKDALQNQVHNRMHLLYANQSAATTLFRQGLQELQQQFPHYLQVQHFLSCPEGPAPANRLSATAVAQALQALDPANTLVVVCAPEGIVKMAWQVARQLGLAEQQFMYESFTTNPMNIHEVDIPSTNAAVQLVVGPQSYQGQVTQQQTLLQGLLQSKVPIEHSCMSGDCGLCACHLAQGKVVGVQGKQKTIYQQGQEILPCVCYPNTPKVKLVKV